MCLKCAMLIYIPTCIHTYVHTYIRAHIHACTHTYVHTYIRAPIHTYVHTYVHAYMRAHIHTGAHTYVHTYMRAHIHTGGFLRSLDNSLKKSPQDTFVPAGIIKRFFLEKIQIVFLQADKTLRFHHVICKWYNFLNIMSGEHNCRKHDIL